MKQFDLEHEKIHLGLLFLTLLVPLVLYLGRELDDNRLTSWAWVFEVAHPGRLWLALLVLSPLLWLLARASLPSLRHPLLPALVAFALSFLFVDVPEVIVDASRYFVQAKLLKEQGVFWFLREWGNEIFAWTDLPLLPFFYGLLFSLFGELRLAAQLGNAALFAGSVYLIALLGRDLWDEETGLMAAWLLLGFPFLYSQLPLMLVDIGTMTMLLLAMVTWYRALGRGGGLRLLAAGVALAAALLVKYSAWLLLLAGLGPLLLVALAGPGGLVAEPGPLAINGQARGGAFTLCGRLPANCRPVLIRALLIGLVALLLLIPWLLAHWQVMTVQMELLATYQRPGLQRWGESLLSTFLFQTHPLLTAGLLYSAFRAWRRREGRWLAVAFLLILLLGFMEIRRIRYTLPLFPLVALLAAYGMQGISERRVRRHLVLAVVAPSLLLAWGAFRPFLQSMGESNLQAAGAYLDRLAGERVAVIIVPAAEPVLDERVTLPLLDIFTRKRLTYHPLAPASGERPEDVDISPLRFTWEFPTPAFYRADGEAALPRTVVVISSVAQPELPPAMAAELAALPVKREFARNSEVFLHRNFVVVHHAPDIYP